MELKLVRNKFIRQKYSFITQSNEFDKFCLKEFKNLLLINLFIYNKLSSLKKEVKLNFTSFL